MIIFPVVPMYFEVEYDGHSVYTCFDLRDALHSVQFLKSDKDFLNHFAVEDLAISMYFEETCLVIWVWNVHNDSVPGFDSAKVLKFFDLEESNDGGSEKS